MAHGFKDSSGKFHPTGNNGTSSRDKSISTSGGIRMKEKAQLDIADQIQLVESATNTTNDIANIARKATDDEVTKQLLIELSNNYSESIYELRQKIEDEMDQGMMVKPMDVVKPLSIGDRFTFQLQNTIKDIDPVFKTSIKMKIQITQNELREVRDAVR